MILTKLSIAAFRNLRDIHITPSPTLNVICGENGQGKTNLLEAIWLFTASKSFHGASDAELLPFDQDFLRVEAEFRDSVRENSASYAINSAKKKEAQLNGIKKSSMSIFSKNFYCVVFSPDDLTLVKGGPAERRRELDLVICQLKPQYNKLLGKYNKLITERNALLRKIREETFPDDLLLTYDEALAKAGALLSLTRKTYSDRLCAIASSYYEKISSNRETLTFHYQSWGEELTADAYQEMLETKRARDISACATLSGSHRDDLVILLDGRPARDFASQGQQRSIVLALKLAESVLIEQTTDEAPIILLDDVLSELDAKRRQYLLENLSERQIFLTCCDYGQVSDTDTIYFIKDGKLTEKEAVI